MLLSARMDQEFYALRSRLVKHGEQLDMGAPSRLLRNRLSGRQAFISALTDVSKERLVPVPGGVLVLDDESYMLGGVEVSGDTSERDEL